MPTIAAVIPGLLRANCRQSCASLRGPGRHSRTKSGRRPNARPCASGALASTRLPVPCSAESTAGDAAGGAELRGQAQRLGHRQAVRQLDGAQVVIGAAHVERPLEEIEQRQVAGVGVRAQEAVPGAQTVGRDLADRRPPARAPRRRDTSRAGTPGRRIPAARARAARGTRRRASRAAGCAGCAGSGRAGTPARGRARRLRGAPAEPAPSRRSVATRLRRASRGAARQIGVGREQPALRHDDDLVARRHALANRARERDAERALAGLHAIGERRVEEVHAAGRAARAPPGDRAGRRRRRSRPARVPSPKLETQRRSGQRKWPGRSGKRAAKRRVPCGVARPGIQSAWAMAAESTATEQPAVESGARGKARARRIPARDLRRAERDIILEVQRRTRTQRSPP